MVSYRLLRAVIVAGLAALLLSTHVFVAVDLLRVKIVEAPQRATAGVVSVTTTDFPQVNALSPPFALIARINHQSAETGRFVITADGAAVCERRVAGGRSRRIDCPLTTMWNPAAEHLVTITGPSTDWTLDYLELATHHGNTSGAHYLIILPWASGRYARPAPVWIAATWLVLSLVLLTPAPQLQPRWIRIVYRAIATLVVTVMAACLVSDRVSDYRVVIFRDSFVLWIVLLLTPRLWMAGRWLAHAVKRSTDRLVALGEQAGLPALAPLLVPFTVAAVVVATVTLGMLKGAFYAGGADAYGYVSQAHFWAIGTPRVEQPFVKDMNWPFAAQALAPLGYSPTPERTAMVPIYSAGYPLLMAVFEWLGGRQAVFYVVPLVGGLAVWATYLMGIRVGGPAIGIPSAVLLATSPAFLFQLMFPMSDVPVTAWWALALALVVSDHRGAVFAAGLAAGAAILTRPNLVLLTPVPGALLLWRAARERTLWGPAVQRLVLFAVGVVAGCSAVASINARFFGSPWVSGYGSLGSVFVSQNLLPNLALYPRWLIQTETPVIFLAFLAPFLVKPADRAVVVMWSAFIAAVFGSYVFFRVFDGWIWLRYLLPAFPPLLVLMSVALTALMARLPGRARMLATVAVVGALSWHGVRFALDEQVFDFRTGEQKVVAIGEYVARALPERAAVISMHHSGSVRYYSGRLTVRYDYIPDEQLDSVVNELRRLGYHPYFVLEEWEEPNFRARFHEHSALAALDWSPVAWLDHSTRVRIYDPADRDKPLDERHASVVIR
ncbi:MAG TPA: hypothetical protein VM818_07190 [Vicinamibacterales bacterium]|nr:hypothetical protein [Vicinamibacterales bacterium]